MSSGRRPGAGNKQMMTAKRKSNWQKAADDGLMGRKATTIEDINWSAFESLCYMQCIQGEVCSVLKISDKVLRRLVIEKYNQLDATGRRVVDGAEPATDDSGVVVKEDYTMIVKRLSAGGCASLRRAQYKSAVESNNTTMQIWLGKQYLGQSDQVVVIGGHDTEKTEYDILEKLYEEGTVQAIPQNA